MLHLYKVLKPAKYESCWESQSREIIFTVISGDLPGEGASEGRETLTFPIAPGPGEIFQSSFFLLKGIT